MGKNPCVGHEIAKLSHQIRRFISNLPDRRKLDNITGSNGHIIGFIAHSTIDVFQKDIEEEFSLTRSTVSKVLTLMEEKGLIVRKAVDYDARLKKIVLTQKALEIEQVASKGIEVMEKTLVNGFTNEEIQTFINMIVRMKSNLKKL